MITMNRRTWIISGLALALVVAGAVLLVFRPARDQEHPTTIIETVNTVDAHPNASDDWRPARENMLIFGGGQVRTGTASWARLELPSAVLRLSADSIFTVKKSTAGPEGPITALLLQEGRLWAHLTSNQPQDFSVETGTAVAAVRDTRFSVRATLNETLVSVAEGEVTLTAQDQSVIVAAEQQASVLRGEPPSRPVPMSDGERALWATEGELPALAPPTPTPPPTPVRVEMGVDVYCGLAGSAGAPVLRNPTTAFDAVVQSPAAAQVEVKTPDGASILMPPFGDIYGREQRFHARVDGLPPAGGIYRFTALAADGNPIPGAAADDVYVGGHEPDPPANVRAELTDSGLLVMWDSPPVIPGAFDPSAAPPNGFYQISLGSPETGTAYGWNQIGEPLGETSHLIPFRSEHFGPGDRGSALDELEDGVYGLVVDAFSTAPPDSAGHANECSALDLAEIIDVIVENGVVRIQEP